MATKLLAPKAFVGWIIALIAAISGQGVFSQSLQTDDRFQLAGETLGGGIRTNSLGGFSSFAPASPSDPDIGDQVLLQPAKQYEPFTVFTNWSVLWTNNADLLDDTQGSDTYGVGTLGVNFLPYLGKNFFGEFTAQQSAFRYANDSSLDFNALTLTAGLIHVVRELGDLAIFARYEYDLLTSRGMNSEIFNDHSIDAGLRKSWIVTRAILIYSAAGADFSLGGQPDYALQNDFYGVLGSQITLTRIVTLDGYYRISAQAYHSNGRGDFNQLIGGGVTLNLTRWLSVQSLSSISINRSNQSEYNYFAANLGGGLSIQVTF